MSSADKIRIVDEWMLWKRYNEEVVQTKKEMVTYLRFLSRQRSSLEQSKCKYLEEAASSTGEEADVRLNLGKAVITAAEINLLTFKISEALVSFKLDDGRLGNIDPEFSSFDCRDSDFSSDEFVSSSEDDEIEEDYIEFLNLSDQEEEQN